MIVSQVCYKKVEIKIPKNNPLVESAHRENPKEVVNINKSVKSIIIHLYQPKINFIYFTINVGKQQTIKNNSCYHRWLQQK